MSEDKDKIIERIKKLLRLSESPNENEAKAALDKANALMEEYQLSISVQDAKESLDEKHEWHFYEVQGLRMKYHYVVTLGWAAALLFDGGIVNNRRLHGTRFWFVSKPSDLPAMKAMFEYLWESWQSIVEKDLRVAKKDIWDNHRGTFSPKDTMKFKQGHGVAFANMVWRRCKELAEERKIKVKATPVGNDLVVYNEASLEEAMKETVKYRTKVRTGNMAGYMSGTEAGKSIPLGGAIDKASSGRFLS